MGRLFWKIFLFIWLGQMGAVATTGVLFWLEREGADLHLVDLQRPPLPPHVRGHAGWPPPSMPPENLPPPRPRERPFRLPIVPALAGLLASFACAGGMAWYFAGPIRRLRAGLDRVAGGELAVRVGPQMGGRRDELADLGRDFDRMAERLQALVEGQRRLLHDVSHELRTPLARLQAATGLARQQPARMEDSLQRIERESERMNRLIGELLGLSRLESGEAGAQESVDIGDLLSVLVEDARFEGAPRQIAIDYQPAPPAEVRAHPDLLHRAIENVVRNALRYSPEGGTIRIAAGCEAGDVVIEIADQGPGVPEADLPAIFTPFVRGANATPCEGYGLGLAIAQRVVSASGGTIAASNRSVGGLLVRIRLPRCRV